MSHSFYKEISNESLNQYYQELKNESKEILSLITQILSTIAEKTTDLNNSNSERDSLLESYNEQRRQEIKEEYIDFFAQIFTDNDNGIDITESNCEIGYDQEEQIIFFTSN